MIDEKLITGIEYFIVPTLEYNPYGVATATWDGSGWDFGQEMHTFDDLDEATDAYHDAQNSDLSNIKAITLYSDTVYENDIDIDTDVIMHSTFEEGAR